MNEYTGLTSLILNGKFKEAHKLILEKKTINISLMAMENPVGENITMYSFFLYILYQDDSFYIHDSIIGLLLVPFTFLTGAYSEIYYHASYKNKLATNLEDSIGNQLVLYGIPGGGISDEEAREILLQIDAQHPVSEWGLEALKETDYLKEKTYPSVKEIQQTLIEQDAKKALETFILTGRFIPAEDILPLLSSTEIDAIMRKIAFAQNHNDRNICAYAFGWRLLKKNETASRHLFLAEISWELFRFRPGEKYQIPGAGAVRFFHVHRAAELEPDNLEIQEQLLDLYEPGNESFDLQETKTFVERVLIMNPESEQALRVKKLIF